MDRAVVRFIDYGCLGVSAIVAMLCVAAACFSMAYRRKKHATATAFGNLWTCRVALMLSGAAWSLSQLLSLQVIWADNSPLPTGSLTQDLDESIVCRVYLVLGLGLLQYFFLLLVYLMVNAPLVADFDPKGPAAVPRTTNRKLLGLAFAGALAMGILQGVAAWLGTIVDEAEDWVHFMEVGFSASHRSSPYACWNESLEHAALLSEEQGMDANPDDTDTATASVESLMHHDGLGSCRLCVFPLVSFGICVVAGVLYCLALSRAMLWRAHSLRKAVVNQRLRKRATRLFTALAIAIVMLVVLQGVTMWDVPHTWAHELSRAGFQIAQAVVILAVGASLVVAPMWESRSVDAQIAELRKLDAETETSLMGGFLHTRLSDAAALTTSTSGIGRLALVQEGGSHDADVDAPLMTGTRAESARMRSGSVGAQGLHAKGNRSEHYHKESTDDALLTADLASPVTSDKSRGAESATCTGHVALTFPPAANNQDHATDRHADDSGPPSSSGHSLEPEDGGTFPLPTGRTPLISSSVSPSSQLRTTPSPVKSPSPSPSPVPVARGKAQAARSASGPRSRLGMCVAAGVTSSTDVGAPLLSNTSDDDGLASDAASHSAAIAPLTSTMDVTSKPAPEEDETTSPFETRYRIPLD